MSDEYEFKWHIPKYWLILASSEISAEKKLIETLLGDYNIYARPVEDPSQTLRVFIDVSMKQIVDVVNARYLLSWLG